MQADLVSKPGSASFSSTVLSNLSATEEGSHGTERSTVRSERWVLMSLTPRTVVASVDRVVATWLRAPMYRPKWCAEFLVNPRLLLIYHSWR